MKKIPERESLLEVLTADNSGGERESLLQLTLQHVRHRRSRRRRAGATLVVGMLTALGWAGWQWEQGERRIVAEQSLSERPASGLRIVGTEPLPESQFVRTQSGRVSVVRSVAGAVMIVETARVPRAWTAIDDRQLLALVDDQAILVREESGRAELIFLTPADRGRFAIP